MILLWLISGILLVQALEDGCPLQCSCRDDEELGELHVSCKTNDSQVLELTQDLPLNVTHLYLNKGGISKFPETVFRRYSMLKVLNLQSNQIQTIPHMYYHGKTIILSGNPIECDCAVQQLSKYNTVIGNCSKPDNVSGISIMNASIQCVQCLSGFKSLRYGARPIYEYNTSCPMSYSCATVVMVTGSPHFNDSKYNDSISDFSYVGKGCIELRDGQCNCSSYDESLKSLFGALGYGRCNMSCCTDDYCNAWTNGTLHHVISEYN